MPLLLPLLHSLRSLIITAYHWLIGFFGLMVHQYRAKACQKSAASLTYVTLFATVPMLTVTFSMFSLIPAFQNLGDQLGITCIMVSHEPADLLAWADELLLMKDGHIIQQGSPLQVYTQPVNEYAAGLLGEYSLVDAAFLQQPVVTGKKLFLRPDQFHIGSSDEHSYNGIIDTIHYRGAYQMLEVVFQQQSFFMLQKSERIQVGDVLNFQITCSSNWYL